MTDQPTTTDPEPPAHEPHRHPLPPPLPRSSEPSQLSHPSQPLPGGGPGARADAAAPQSLGRSLAGLAVVVALLGYLAYRSIGSFLFVVALLVIVFLHELGHFLTARWAGMKVTQFFIGFGSLRIFSFRRGEVEYGLKPILLGAYVRIIGMHNMEEVDPADEPRAYRQKGYWRRLSVAVAGSTMHFIIALVLLFAMLVSAGRPRPDLGWVVRPSAASAASAAGVRDGDRIVSIDGVAVVSSERLSTSTDVPRGYQAFTDYIRAHPGQTVALVVTRGGRQVTLHPTLANKNPKGEAVGFLGIGLAEPWAKDSAVGTVTHSFGEFGRITGASVTGLGKIFGPHGLQRYGDAIFKGKPTDDRLLSPIGAAQLGDSAARDGVKQFLLLMASLNIFVGIVNLFPLLPFDGGHVAIATYEAIRSRRGKRYHADVNKMLPFSYAIMAALLILFVGNVYLDIAHPVG